MVPEAVGSSLTCCEAREVVEAEATGGPEEDEAEAACGLEEAESESFDLLEGKYGSCSVFYTEKSLGI